MATFNGQLSLRNHLLWPLPQKVSLFVPLTGQKFVCRYWKETQRQRSQARRTLIFWRSSSFTLTWLARSQRASLKSQHSTGSSCLACHTLCGIGVTPYERALYQLQNSLLDHLDLNCYRHRGCEPLLNGPHLSKPAKWRPLGLASL